MLCSASILHTSNMRTYLQSASGLGARTAQKRQTFNNWKWHQMNTFSSKTKVRLPSTHESGRCIAQAGAQAATVAR